VVETVSYRILYVFFLLRHDRREWIHFNVTASPTAAWIWQQVMEATPLGRQPKFLIHDRDADYGGDFDGRLANLGITGVRTPPRAPKANAIGERIVRTIRTECLEHIIVINERHLQAVLAEFADYYNRERPHRSLGLRSPVVAVPQPSGRVVSRSVLGGLHHAYARAA
jgi:putative transposase